MIASSTAPLSRTLAERTGGLVGSVIDSSTTLLAVQTHDIVRFAMGAPSDDLMPRELLNHYLCSPFPGKYAYGASEGEPALVHQVLELFGQLPTADPRRITVTTGGMQGLDLAFKLFVDPGDLVIVEGPTYTNGSATALSYGAQVVEVPVDADGMDVDALELIVAGLARTPKVIYTIPNFQNPSGVTLSRARRERLIELADRWQSVIVDDDPYGVLRFSGEPVESFHEIDPGNPRVFSVRTFSKTLAPGLRLGWVEADASLQTMLINAKQAMDTCASIPTQFAVAAFLTDGHFWPHVERVRGLYLERKDAMRTALERHFGSRVSATDPDGGFFLWASIVDGSIDTGELFERALAMGVAYIPGSAFSVDGNFRNDLRLCFATSSPDRIDEGVSRLHAAIETMSR